MKRERLDRNPDLGAPARSAIRAVAASQMPSQSALSLSPPGLISAVVARAGRIDGEHVARAAVEERPEDDADVILGRRATASRRTLKLTMLAGSGSSQVMPMTSDFGSARTCTRVRADGGAPSTGSVWRKSSIDSADCHAGSVKCPSIASGIVNLPACMDGAVAVCASSR